MPSVYEQRRTYCAIADVVRYHIGMSRDEFNEECAKRKPQSPEEWVSVAYIVLEQEAYKAKILHTNTLPAPRDNLDRYVKEILGLSDIISLLLRGYREEHKDRNFTVVYRSPGSVVVSYDWSRFHQ